MVIRAFLVTSPYKTDIRQFVGGGKENMIFTLFEQFCASRYQKFRKTACCLPRMWVHQPSSKIHNPIMWTTGIGARMSHRIWRVTKLHPSRTSSGHQIRCCLFSLHFLSDILAPIPVDKQSLNIAISKLLTLSISSAVYINVDYAMIISKGQIQSRPTHRRKWWRCCYVSCSLCKFWNFVYLPHQLPRSSWHSRVIVQDSRRWLYSRVR